MPDPKYEEEDTRIEEELHEDGDCGDDCEYCAEELEEAEDDDAQD